MRSEGRLRTEFNDRAESPYLGRLHPSYVPSAVSGMAAFGSADERLIPIHSDFAEVASMCHDLSAIGRRAESATVFKALHGNSY